MATHATPELPEAEGFRKEGFLAKHSDEFLTSLRAYEPDRFDLCDEINRFTMEVCWAVQVHTSDADRVVAALLLVKGVNAFQAAVLLAGRGMCPESETISRTGLECAIELAALAKNPAHFKKMLSAHDRHRGTQSRELLKVYERMGQAQENTLELRAIRESAKLTGEKLTLEQTAREVGLDTLYQTIYRGISGSAAHATIGALNRFLTRAGGEDMITLGVDKESIGHALDQAIPVLLECLTPFGKIWQSQKVQDASLAFSLKWHAIVTKAR
jgi:hypothetical protein